MATNSRRFLYPGGWRPTGKAMDAIFGVAILFLPTVIYMMRTPYKVNTVAILDGNFKMLLILIAGSLIGTLTSKEIGYATMILGWGAMCIMVWKQTNYERAEVAERRQKTKGQLK